MFSKENNLMEYSAVVDYSLKRNSRAGLMGNVFALKPDITNRSQSFVFICFYQSKWNLLDRNFRVVLREFESLSMNFKYIRIVCRIWVKLFLLCLTVYQTIKWKNFTIASKVNLTFYKKLVSLAKVPFFIKIHFLLFNTFWTKIYAN